MKSCLGSLPLKVFPKYILNKSLSRESRGMFPSGGGLGPVLSFVEGGRPHIQNLPGAGGWDKGVCICSELP